MRSVSNITTGYFLLYFVVIDLLWHYSAKIMNDSLGLSGFHSIM